MQLPLWLHTTLHPECFHGHRQKPPFFEGWYYKLVDAQGKHRLALIPGVFRGEDRAQHHSFIQVLNGSQTTATYCRFGEGEFRAAERALEVHVGGSRFSEQAIDVDLDHAELRLKGQLRLGPLAPWPSRWTSPGVMGWYAWAPFMQCYHGVVSLDHALAGQLELNGETLDFEGGRGYIEKDWGRSFPAAWVWMQSNHFPQAGTCLTASVAIIPWLTGQFAGFLVGVWHQGQLYRLTTYTGARIERLEISDERIVWTLANRRWRLEIESHQAPGAELLGPSQVEMGVRVAETLDAVVTMRLSHRGGGVIFEGTGGQAGLEACGDLPRLCRLVGRGARYLGSRLPADAAPARGFT